MLWIVTLTRNTEKQLIKLPEKIKLISQLLVNDLEKHGYYPGSQWPNFSKLQGKQDKYLYHCHLIKGRPTYVACWKITNKKLRKIEVYYVGTHENAPY